MLAAIVLGRLVISAICLSVYNPGSLDQTGDRDLPGGRAHGEEETMLAQVNQERVVTAKEKFPMLFGYEGDIQMIEQLVDLDPLLFLGKVGSAFTRLSSTELANVSSGGGMVPTFIISE